MIFCCYLNCDSFRSGEEDYLKYQQISLNVYNGDSIIFFQCLLLLHCTSSSLNIQSVFFYAPFFTSSYGLNFEDIDLHFFANCRRRMLVFFYIPVLFPVFKSILSLLLLILRQFKEVYSFFCRRLYNTRIFGPILDDRLKEKILKP